MTYPPIPLAVLLGMIILQTQVFKYLPGRFKSGRFATAHVVLTITWPVLTLVLAWHAAWNKIGTILLSAPTALVCFLLILFFLEMVRKFLIHRDYTPEEAQHLREAEQRAASGQKRPRITKLSIVFDFLPMVFVLNLLVQSLLTAYLAG